MSNQIEGLVASIGGNGGLITDISVDQLVNIPHDDSVRIKFSGHETLGIYPASHDHPEATMVASLGASGFLEIEIVGVSLSDMLSIKSNTPVTVVW